MLFTWDKILVCFQLPVVAFIVVSSFLAARHFGGRLSRLVLVGWAVNGVYLVWHNFISSGVGASPSPNFFVSAFEPAVSVLGSACWLAAGRNRERKHPTFYSALVAISLAATVAALAFGATGWATTLPRRVEVILPVVLFESFALFELGGTYRDLAVNSGIALESRFRWPKWSDSSSLVGLLPVGIVMYMCIQPLRIAVEFPDLRDIAMTTGFLLGLLSKLLIATGIFVLFIASSHRLEMERSRLLATRNVLGRLSHEAGTPLSQMGVYLRLAFSAIRDRRPVQPHLQEIESVHERLYVIVAAAEAEVVDSRAERDTDAPNAERVVRASNINVIIERAVAAVKQTRADEAKEVEWIFRYSGNCCVECSVPELLQVFVACFRNALDAVVDNLEADSRYVLVTTRNIRNGQGPTAKREVEVSILDNGGGVPESDKLRVFDNGFSTRTGPNRGHGLAVVTDLVRQNRGSVILDSPAWPVVLPVRGTKLSFRFARVTCQDT